MPTFSRIKTWVSNEVLTASDLNAEFDNLLNNMTPAGIEDASANVAAMQATVNPGGVGTESLATTLAGDIQRLRYAIKQIKGTPQWYGTPAFDMETGVNTTDIVDLAVTAAKLAANSVTTVKILDGNVTAAKLASSAVATFQSQTITASGNFTVPANVNELIVIGCGGGGGGGSGGGAVPSGSGGAGGHGGNGAPILVSRLAVTPAATLAAVIGTGGAGGSAPSGTNAGNAGANGVSTTFDTLTFPGGEGGLATTTTTTGVLPVCVLGCARGGRGQDDSVSVTAGDRTQYAAGGTVSAGGNLGVGDGAAGGGGGAAFGAGGAGGAFKSVGVGGGGNVGTAAAANSGAGGGAGGGRTVGAGSSGAGAAGGSGKIIVMWVATP